jgi:hypothetical protein
MWQLISPSDVGAVRATLLALTARDSTWRNIDQLQAWMQGLTVNHYTSNDAGNCEFVVGYEFRMPEAEWQAAIAGGGGDLSVGALSDVVQQILGLMRQQGTRTLFVTTTPRGATDPIEIICSTIAAGLRQDSAVLEVSEQMVGAHKRREIVLR